MAYVSVCERVNPLWKALYVVRINLKQFRMGKGFRRYEIINKYT